MGRIAAPDFSFAAAIERGRCAPHRDTRPLLQTTRSGPFPFTRKGPLVPRFNLIALLLLALGYTLALSQGNPGITTLPTFLALLASALLARRPQRWQQALGHTLFILLAIALALHWLPGFNSTKVIDGVILSPGALPFTMYLNLDKPLIGAWRPACYSPCP